MNQLLVIIKPDAIIRRGAGARMIKEFLHFVNGDIIASTKIVIPKKVAELHYSHLNERSFYKWLIDYITCYESIIIIIKTNVSFGKIREFLGNTIVEKANPSSLRYIYGLADGMNGLHVSESEEAGQKEIDLWFKSGLIQPNVQKYNLNEYIKKYELSPNFTELIRKHLYDSNAKDNITEKQLKTDSILSLIRKEGFDVNEDDLNRFFMSFKMGLDLH